MSKVSDLVQIALTPQQAEFLGHTQDNALAAAGNSQGTATLITKTINRLVTITAGSADGLRLPPIATVKKFPIYILNDTLTDADLFPSTGETINSLSANTAIAFPSLAFFTCSPITSTKWMIG